MDPSEQSLPWSLGDQPVRPTLRDVARRSGLSLGTVSRILNNGNKCVWRSTALRDVKVKEIARQLGYRPNFRARSLRNRKSNTVALVCGLSSPLLYGAYEALAGTIVSVLEAYRYHLLFLPLPPESIGTWPTDILRNGRVDGCIAMDPLPQVVSVALTGCGLPLVGINVERSFPCVQPDDLGGMAALVEHLLRLGHRRIAFFAGSHPEAPHYSLHLRKRGFLAEMNRRGLGAHATVHTHSVDVFVERWRSEAPSSRPTAIIVYQGLQALPMHHLLLAAGVRIPRDVSLATFDELPAMRCLTPPLTTVDVPIAELGSRAAELLIRRLELGEALPTEAILMPERLIVRGSTARPNSA